MGKTKEKQKPTFAINMVARRNQMGFRSAEAFSEHSGIPYPTIRDIEAGESGGSPSTKAKIAEKLGCTVDFLNTPQDPATVKPNNGLPPGYVAVPRDVFDLLNGSLTKMNEKLKELSTHMENVVRSNDERDLVEAYRAANRETRRRISRLLHEMAPESRMSKHK